MLALITLTTFVVANTNEIDQATRNDFNARLEHVTCKIELTKKQIELLIVVDPELEQHKQVLDEDKLNLQAFAEGWEHKDFNTYLTTIFKDNLKNAVKELRDAKLTLRKSALTRDEKIKIRDNHKIITEEYASCTSIADDNWVKSRVQYLNAWVLRWNTLLNEMKEGGYDISEMEKVMIEVNEQLLPEIENLRDSTKDNRRIFMQNARSLHLHSWARFEIARINSYLDSVEEKANEKGYQTMVDSIKVKLEEASALASPGKRYAPGEFEAVWKTLKDTVQMLKEMNKKLQE